jgi:hypothetical protein
MFKSNLTFDDIDGLPHFIDLLLGHQETKLMLGFGPCAREVKQRAEFAIVWSRQQRLFAGVPGVEGDW